MRLATHPEFISLPGEGGLVVKHSSQYPTHAMPAESTNAVTSVVLCAQGHVMTVTSLMVGPSVALYTYIIERG